MLYCQGQLSSLDAAWFATIQTSVLGRKRGRTEGVDRPPIRGGGARRLKEIIVTLHAGLDGSSFLRGDSELISSPRCDPWEQGVPHATSIHRRQIFFRQMLLLTGDNA